MSDHYCSQFRSQDNNLGELCWEINHTHFFKPFSTSRLLKELLQELVPGLGSLKVMRQKTILKESIWGKKPHKPQGATKPNTQGRRVPQGLSWGVLRYLVGCFTGPKVSQNKFSPENWYGQESKTIFWKFYCLTWRLKCTKTVEQKHQNEWWLHHQHCPNSGARSNDLTYITIKRKKNIVTNKHAIFFKREVYQLKSLCHSLGAPIVSIYFVISQILKSNISKHFKRQFSRSRHHILGFVTCKWQVHILFRLAS